MPLRPVLLLALAALAGPAGVRAAATPAAERQAAADRPHVFDIGYRGWGPVESRSRFEPRDGYALRFEGCYAKASPEAVCAFTLRAARDLRISNLDNPAHAVSGARALRVCCMFAAGAPEGWPIRAPGADAAGVRDLAYTARRGQTVPILLRVPEARAEGPVTGIWFSRGAGDPGVLVPARVTELAGPGAPVPPGSQPRGF